jgi:chromosomal replication initiation ATPase DnaA
MSFTCPHCHGSGMDPSADGRAMLVIAAIAAEHGVPVNELDSNSRDRSRFEARWHAAYELLRGGFSKVTIGRLLGYSTHAPVVHAVRQWERVRPRYRELVG